jgi:predicted PurR-regulated permease PerM
VGLSLALFEAPPLKGGALQVGNFGDYTPLRMSEMPELDISIIANDDPPRAAASPRSRWVVWRDRNRPIRSAFSRHHRQSDHVGSTGGHHEHRAVKLFDSVHAASSETRLVRALAFTFIGAAAIAALYFGQEVLLPTAVAIFLAFILGPATSWLRRFVPRTLAVSAIVLLAVAFFGSLTMFVMSQLADVAGSLPTYQTNLQHKIKDLQGLTEDGGALSRFTAMIASLASNFTVHEGGKAATAPIPTIVQSGSSVATVAAFALSLLHPLLAVGIVLILVVFILLDRDHISDQVVRLVGGSNVHATSEALEDAAGRVARVLMLQVLTNFGFAITVGVGLFALGTPNPIVWGLLAGGLRFIPYVGATIGAILPTLISFAVFPGWLPALLVLAWIVGIDIVLGQIVEPLIFGDSTGVTPLALILSALFWGTLWGPVGLLLSTPITICLLVIGKRVPNLGFLHVLLGDQPALLPYQQVYRRLIRRAPTEASAVALAEIDEKGEEPGLDESLGRMVVLAEEDRAADRLSPEQVDAIVDGTDHVIDFLDEAKDEEPDEEPARPEASSEGPQAAPERAGVFVRCVGGRGQIDDAAASVIAFGLRQAGLHALGTRKTGSAPAVDAASFTIDLICYASHPSDAVRRYTSRKARSGGQSAVRHAVVDYDVAPARASTAGKPEQSDIFVGDLSTISRLVSQTAAELSTIDKTLSSQRSG